MAICATLVMCWIDVTHDWLAVWAGLNQCSCAMSDLVSTRIGDHLWTGKTSRYVTSQLGRLSLLLSMGR